MVFEDDDYDDSLDYSAGPPYFFNLGDVITKEGLKKLKNNEISDSFYLYDYIPEKYEDNNSRLIMLLRDKNSYAINRFAEILFEILTKDSPFVICCMPSINPDDINPGIYTVVEKLCEKQNKPEYFKCRWINGANILTRKSLTSGESVKSNFSSFDEEYDSLEIPTYPPGTANKMIYGAKINPINSHYVKSYPVLLLEDVYKTNQTINVAVKKLMDFGANYVVVISLGKPMK